MDGTEELDRRGRALLAELADDPDGQNCARQFDSLYYEIVWRYLRANHAVLATRVGRYLGQAGNVAPAVLQEEIEEVVHDATKTALRRVRQNAHKFDATKGSPTRWVIGAAEYAYVEVAKAVVTARRSDRLEFVDPLDLLDVPDRNRRRRSTSCARPRTPRQSPTRRATLARRSSSPCVSVPRLGTAAARRRRGSLVTRR